jgi:UDP-glucuronate 4-epimerase
LNSRRRRRQPQCLLRVRVKDVRLAELARCEPFHFCKLALKDRNDVVAPFAEGKSTSRGAFRRPGRRASRAQSPHGNIDSNIAGFLNVPESCRHAGKWSQ